MNDRARFFLMGTLAAGVITATAFDVHGLEAVSKRVAVSYMAPELRLSIDIGLLDAADVRLGLVDAPIVRRDFARLLKQTLLLLGAPAGSEMSDLASSGIFAIGSPKKMISRRHTLEALYRTIIHLSDSGLLTLPEPRAEGFKDYTPPVKYQAALAYLREKGIARGYQSGIFGVEKMLTKREAVYFLYRLYEQTAAGMGARGKASDIFFVDIPNDHPVMPSIRAVAKAGGFDQVPLKPSFDGNRQLLRRDAVLLLKGILEKRAGTSGKKAVSVDDPFGLVDRAELAVLMESLLVEPAGESSQSPGISSFTYIDVGAGTPEAKALEALSRHNIHLGYADGRLRGNQIVTWFETVGVLANVLPACGDEQKVDDSSSPAKQEDFEKYVDMLREKKARIRSILDHKRPSMRK
ncbi:MAG: S-layer homology domain-containing protein [Candidatus Ozemobacteraceae bacterium]